MPSPVSRSTLFGLRLPRPAATRLWGLIALAIFGPAGNGWAAEAVIGNQTAVPVVLRINELGARAREFRLAAGDNLTVPLGATARLAVEDRGHEQTFAISPYTPYVLIDRGGRVSLRTVGLQTGLASPPLILPSLFEPTTSSAPARPLGYVVPVKILVDEDERATRAVWEKRLRERIANASQILERACGVRLEVVAVDTWRSDNTITEFPQSLQEFERQVKSSGERLSIGFTSQYHLVRGTTHLGGIRGPLARHLLVREWSQIITEPERLEVLLHELSHFLGAAHSRETDSVMRPILADRRARSVKFRIGLDPLNTLAVATVTDQLRRSDQRQGLQDLDLPAQLVLRPLYGELVRAMPDDPNPARYATLIDQSGIGRTGQATRALLAGIAAILGETPRPVADASVLLSLKAAPPGPDERLRSTFRFLPALPADQRLAPCLLAVALSGSARQLVADHALARPICQRAIVGQGQDEERQGHDASSYAAEVERLLASAALTALVGPELAEAAALADVGLAAQPVAESIRLADYADRLAGIALTTRLAALPPAELESALDELAATIQSEHLLPDISLASAPADKTAVPAVMSGAAFSERFGSAADERFLQWRRQIWRQFCALEQLKSAN